MSLRTKFTIDGTISRLTSVIENLQTQVFSNDHVSYQNDLIDFTKLVHQTQNDLIETLAFLTQASRANFGSYNFKNTDQNTQFETNLSEQIWGKLKSQQINVLKGAMSVCNFFQDSFWEQQDEFNMQKSIKLQLQNAKTKLNQKNKDQICLCELQMQTSMQHQQKALSQISNHFLTTEAFLNRAKASYQSQVDGNSIESCQCVNLQLGGKKIQIKPPQMPPLNHLVEQPQDMSSQNSRSPFSSESRSQNLNFTSQIKFVDQIAKSTQTDQGADDKQNMVKTAFQSYLHNSQLKIPKIIENQVMKKAENDQYQDKIEQMSYFSEFIELYNELEAGSRLVRRNNRISSFKKNLIDNNS